MERENQLSRRERQIMDVLYTKKEATATEVLEALPDPPSNSAVRTLLKILEEKGHIRRWDDFGRFMYEPCVPSREAGGAAMRRILATYFEGSLEEAVMVLFEAANRKLTEVDLKLLREFIRRGGEAQGKGGEKEIRD